MSKWVYTFGDGAAEGRADMRNLLGGKGANLAEMSNLGLPVPPGFTITTEVCTWYYDHDHSYPQELQAQVRDAMAVVEKATVARGSSAAQAAGQVVVADREGAESPNRHSRVRGKATLRRVCCRLSAACESP